MRARPARLTLLGLLLPVQLAVHAAGQWRCTPGADGNWMCSGDTATPAAPAVSPVPPAVEGTAPAAAVPPASTVDKPADAAGERPAAVPAPAPSDAAMEIPPPATAPVQPASTGQMPPEPPGESPGPPAAAVQAGESATSKPPGATPAKAPVPTDLPEHTYAPLDTWALCPPAPQPVPQDESGAPAGAEGTIDLRADNAQASGDGNVYTLTGNAVVRQRQQRLAADTIVYRQDADVVEAEGNLQLSAPGIMVEGTSGVLHPATEQGSLQEVSYVIPEQHGHGSAASVALDGRDRQQLAQVSYTTCPPGNDDWELSAKQLDLDHAEGTGTAHHAKLKLKGVPILYSPWLSFPIDDRRKSGLLFPRYGHTESTGTDIIIPWYWNIAPNRDATIMPRYMSNRGVMLGGEFRYLTRNNRGKLTGEYLPSDNQFDNENRSLVSFIDRGNPFPRLDTRIKASNASDDYIFEDFGTTLVQTSQTNLERTAAADYHGNWWDLGVMVRDFQTLDPGDTSPSKPYKQLPKVSLEAAPGKRLYGFKLSAEAELDYFTISGDQVDGRRLDLLPRISYPITRPAWYVEPAVGLRQTYYDLDNVAAGQDDSPDRTTPIASLDAGTFFERNGQWGESAYIQTLEPRLYYLYVPDKDQDSLPVFDTGDYDFNYWTLFRDNRFSGPDRMGDANQLTLALTSRILDPANGRERLRASLGQLYYFRDREVTLPGQPVETESSSNLIGELALALPRNWNAGADIHWDPHDSRTARNDYLIQYRGGPRQLVNLSYRQRRDTQEQVDFSVLWPLTPSWHAVGRWYYSLQSSEILEAIAGIGYESCCWGVQLVGRSYLKNSDEDRVDEIFMQLELKGLGKLGNRIDDVLERGILDY
ncbi:MAG: LPS assembly protein LptD [Gammaproteobacteria bacterium]|jgi:LPS-assembly protein